MTSNFDELINKLKLPKSTPLAALRALQVSEANADYWAALAHKVTSDPVWWDYEPKDFARVGVSANQFIHCTDPQGHEFSLSIDQGGLHIHVNGHSLSVHPRAANSVTLVAEER